MSHTWFVQASARAAQGSGTSKSCTLLRRLPTQKSMHAPNLADNWKLQSLMASQKQELPWGCAQPCMALLFWISSLFLGSFQSLFWNLLIKGHMPRHVSVGRPQDNFMNPSLYGYGGPSSQIIRLALSGTEHLACSPHFSFLRQGLLLCSSVHLESHSVGQAMLELTVFWVLRVL